MVLFVLYSFRRGPMTDGVMTLGAWRRRLLSGSIRPAHHLCRSIRRTATIVVSRMISPAAFYAPLNIRGMTLSMWSRLGYLIFWCTLVDNSCAVSVRGSATVNLTYQKTIFLHVFIQRDSEIQMMLKNTFFEVVFLLRFWFCFGAFKLICWLFPDVLCYLYRSIIFWGVRRTRIRWWSNSEEAEDGFTKEGNKEYCGKSPPHGRQSYSEGNRICGNTGIVSNPFQPLHLVIYIFIARF